MARGARQESPAAVILCSDNASVLSVLLVLSKSRLSAEMRRFCKI